MATRRAPRPGSLRWQNAWANAWMNANPGRDPSFMATQPSMPDPGTYDPSFDLNRQNAQTGAFRYGQDFARDWGELGAGATGGRQGTDLQTALARSGQQRAWGDEGFARSLSDLQTSRTRGTEDYQQTIAGLLRGYQRLGNNQSQQMRAGGVAGGGASIQAARKRAENQAIDRKPIDTGYNRFMSDSQLAEKRLGEDRGRFNTESQWGIDDINLGYGRGREDAVTDYGRTGVDLQNYLTGQGRLAYYTSGQVQPAGLSIRQLMRRRGMRR